MAQLAASLLSISTIRGSDTVINQLHWNNGSLLTVSKKVQEARKGILKNDVRYLKEKNP